MGAAYSPPASHLLRDRKPVLNFLKSLFTWWNGATIGAASGTVNTGSHYNHSFMLGLRYAFGAPAAAPIPVRAIPAAPLALPTFPS